LRTSICVTSSSVKPNSFHLIQMQMLVHRHGAQLAGWNRT
jgi:hypothetical protein